MYHDEQTPVVVPLIAEELASLMYLAGAAGVTSIVGTVGYGSIDDDGFDVGMRGLLVRGVVAIGADGVVITTIGRDVVRLLCTPEYAAYLFVVEGGTFDTVLLTSIDGLTAAVSVQAEGAFVVGVRPSAMAESVMRILIEQTPETADAEWPVGMRLQALTAEPLDIALGAGRRGLVLNGAPQQASDVEIIAAIKASLVPLPA